MLGFEGCSSGTKSTTGSGGLKTGQAGGGAVAAAAGDGVGSFDVFGPLDPLFGFGILDLIDTGKLK